MAKFENYTTEELRGLVKDGETVERGMMRETAFSRHRPLPFQREWYDACVNKTHKVVCLFCGNRVGKTTLAANIAVGRCLGYFSPGVSGVPLPDVWPVDSQVGKRYLMAGESFEVSLRDVIVPKLKDFVTGDMLAKPPRLNSNGVPVVWTFVTGAELILMSYQQAVDSFEGAPWDGVFLDEPPPWEIFSAVSRGTLEREGQIIITATPLKQPWMLDELLAPAQDPEHPSYGTVVEFKADMWQNAVSNGGVIPDREIAGFLSRLPEKERAAREFGLFADMQGLEFDYMTDDTHVVPEFEVPAGWPLVEVNDPSMKRGLFVCWFVVDPEDYWYCIQAKVIADGAFDEMHQRLQKWRDVLGRMPEVYIMDQRGGAHEINKDLRTTWFDEFRKRGTYYEPSQEVPMQTLHGWLRPKWDPKKEKFLPKLRMTSRVAREERGPLWGFRRFQWNPNESKKRQYNQPGKDWVDDFRYLAGHRGLTFLRLARNPDSYASAPRIATSYAPPPTLRQGSGIVIPHLPQRRSLRPRYGRMR